MEGILKNSELFAFTLTFPFGIPETKVVFQHSREKVEKVERNCNGELGQSMQFQEMQPHCASCFYYYHHHYYHCCYHCYYQIILLSLSMPSNALGFKSFLVCKTTTRPIPPSSTADISRPRCPRRQCKFFQLRGIFSNWIYVILCTLCYFTHTVCNFTHTPCNFTHTV